MREEIELAKQWLAKADNDLLNADNNLSSERVPFDTVCFHCRQAAVEGVFKLTCDCQVIPHHAEEPEGQLGGTSISLSLWKNAPQESPA